MRVITVEDYLITRLTVIKEFLFGLEISVKGLMPVKVIG